jgi:GT2 family glycosyltransferase/glycosyltransferase involved in cell wall biosynthesis
MAQVRRRRSPQAPTRPSALESRQAALPETPAEMYRFVAEEIGRRARVEVDLRSSLARERARREGLERETELREATAGAKADRRMEKLRGALDRATLLREAAEHERKLEAGRLEAELERRSEELREARAELERLRGETDRRAAELVRANEQIEDRLRDLQSGHDHNMTRSMAELESLREEAASLSQRVGVLTKQMGVRDGRLRELEEEAATREQEVQEASRERDEVRLRAARLEERLRGLFDRRDTALRQTNELLSLIDGMEGIAIARTASAGSLGKRRTLKRLWRPSPARRRAGDVGEAVTESSLAKTAEDLMGAALAIRASLEDFVQAESPASQPEGPPEIESSAAGSYESLIEQVKRIVHERLPEDATIAVISKGDPQLVALDRGRAVHFPQGENGEYAGYYPFDSGAAVNHLEDLRARGVQFLLIPSTAFWWMRHYPGFRDHMELRYTMAWADDACLVFDLRTERTDELPDLPGGNGTDVICFPIIDWDFRFQRSQQLLTQFARNGHRVFYVRTTFQSESPRPVVTELAEGVYGVQLPGPPHLNLYRDTMEGDAIEGALGALEHLRRVAGVRNAICMVSLPFWGNLALAARARWSWRVVYDCMDDHSGFSTNGPDMLREERVLSAESDLVLTSSQMLYERIAPVAHRTVLLRNAADFEHFSSDPGTRPLGETEGPVIGYFGAISEWFDVEMVYRAAAARPDWTFVLIGDTFGADVEWLRSLRNVRLLGEQLYATLPGYLHQFDVACIPFRVTPLTLATNPVKFYEYLSGGKPVVSVDLPELGPYREHYYSATPDDFVNQIELAMAEDSPERRRARIDFAREQSWAHRYAGLVEEIRDWYPKASVVILTYTIDPTYIRLCLESIWAETRYPNYEVVVVDNGSAQEVLDYLSAAAVTEPRLRAIFNEENFGFAKGNNIGIQACSDAEVVVLLNDDTMVTPGWLSRLVRYLSDERIGMVGPVTNWTGNEARIEIGYRDVADMKDFAERYTREHLGQSFDIGVLAMFCVGIRKRLLDRLGGLDERFGIGMFEDDDYAMRVRKSWYRVVCAEDVFVHHWGRASMSRLDRVEYRRLFERNKRYFEDKWGPWAPHRPREGLREEFSWQPH